jgi:hypothetical protein
LNFITDIAMSSHSSNNSNGDMEVINAEDLEDSPPPGDAEDVTAVGEKLDAQETKEEVSVDNIMIFIANCIFQEVVVEATASGDTEQIGEIVDVDEVNVNKSATTEVDDENDEGKDEDNDDDPRIEILEAPTPPLAVESVPEPAVEDVPAVEAALVVEVAPVEAAADPTPAAALVETQAPTPAAAPAAVEEDDDDPRGSYPTSYSGICS